MKTKIDQEWNKSINPFNFDLFSGNISISFIYEGTIDLVLTVGLLLQQTGLYFSEPDLALFRLLFPFQSSFCVFIMVVKFRMDFLSNRN